MLRLKCREYKIFDGLIMAIGSKKGCMSIFVFDSEFNAINYLNDRYIDQWGYDGSYIYHKAARNASLLCTHKPKVNNYTYRHDDDYLYRIPKTIKILLNDDPYLRASCKAAYLLLLRSTITDVAQYVIHMWVKYLVLTNDCYLIK